MDRIEFINRPYRDGDRDSGSQIKINGRDLVDLVRAVENPFAYKEGAVSIAGAYAGLPPDENTCLPSTHFLGEPSAALYRFGAKTQVLGCECGEVGCWPLLCVIEAGPTCVTWAQFEQPHRKSGSFGHPASTPSISAPMVARLPSVLSLSCSPTRLPSLLSG